MAVVLQGFLGPFKGKVGGAVGGIWKGINYIKGYVIPANPNTAGQQAQRTKFSNVVALAQNLLGTLISTFWNPFAVKMSGYNYFIQQFINSCDASGFADANTIVAKGSLEIPLLDAGGTYNTATGDVSISWETAVAGNGLANDNVGVLILSKTDNKILYYNADGSTRDTGTAEPTIEGGLTATNLMVYIWAHRGTGSDFVVSNSNGQQLAAL